MDADIYQRLAVVETKVGALQDTVNAVQTDVRTIRDHVVGERATHKAAKRFLSIGGAVVLGIGGLWEAFIGPIFHR